LSFSTTPSDVTYVASRFQIGGTPTEIGPYGNGHLNQTYLVTVGNNPDQRGFILQCLNPVAFPEPRKLMENVQRVLDHLARQTGDSDARNRLTLVPTVTEDVCHFEPDGRCWRCYLFIPNAVGHDVVEHPEQAFQAAYAFGDFQTRLQALPGPPLHETIPDFHHTPKRVRNFRAVLHRDPHNRADAVTDLVRFYLDRAAGADRLLGLTRTGDLRMRPTHNDTKVNNVLLDKHTGRALCVIDLDTLMPGLPAYDFGDLVRSCTSSVPEDHPIAFETEFRFDVFEAIAGGYLAGAGSGLSLTERKSLVDGALLMTYECGLRFLTDHLAGDLYFRIHRPDHNLDRARTQAELLALLEQHEARLRQIVAIS
jgi:hypothetical protein